MTCIDIGAEAQILHSAELAVSHAQSHTAAQSVRVMFWRLAAKAPLSFPVSFVPALKKEIRRCLQGMTIIRAVLPMHEGFPSSEVHMFRKGDLIGTYHPISNVNCVWSFIMPEDSSNTTADNSAGNVSISTANKRGHANTDVTAHTSTHEVRFVRCFLA